MSNPLYANIGDPEDRVIEECAELIEAIMKAKRFGWQHVYNGASNQQRVVIEMEDVLHTIDHLKVLIHQPNSRLAYE